MLITGRGHENITATHETTIAFTRDKSITPRGHCFVAVNCDWKNDLPSLKNILITISCNGKKDEITAQLNPSVDLSSADLVVRKSDWVDPKTLSIFANKAAKDLKTELVTELTKGLPVRIELSPKL